MKWSSGLVGLIREHENVANRTWYGVGGTARYFCTPTTIEQLRDIIRTAREEGLAWRILGAGANVLIRDEGFDGIVLQLDPNTFGHRQRNGQRMTFGAAHDCPDAVRRTVLDGLAGLEALAGIPGTIGGLVRMNAGGRYGNIGDCLHDVTLITHEGRIEQRTRGELDLGYRTSNLSGHIVIDATFDLSEVADPAALKKRYHDIWNFKKDTQPFTRNSAGCAFKNPPGGSAGQLIDRAGLKGATCGGATVSNDHANFLLASPGSRATDILALAERIQESVREQFDVTLEFEIDVW